MNTKQATALVLGGSIAGLLAARVLADHFQQVTILERDELAMDASTRKGTPQGQHLHGLLARGYQVMTQLFPGFTADLLAAGALIKDISADVRWYQGGYNRQSTTGIAAVFISRPRLELLLRQRVLALPAVRLRDACAVVDLVTTGDRQRVTGVTIQDRRQGQPETLTADLVVDATGRGSPTLKWLTALGYEQPTERVVEVGVGYATRLYRRTVSDAQAQAAFVAPNQATETRGGGFFPIEGDRWIATLSGHSGDYPPTSEQGFLEYARSLPAPDLYHLLKNAEPLSAITPYTYPASRRRHYEQMTRFPQRLVVLGDAVCSFNPIYGQGITVCALEALALDEWLRTPALDSRAFFQRIAKVIAVPWALAAGNDLKQATKPTLTSRYLVQLREVSRTDPMVKLAFIRVTQLLAPPASLFHPKLVARVLWRRWRRQGQRQRPANITWQPQLL